jgi:hypothetical protein
MFSLRSKSESARIASAATFFAAVCLILLAAIPALASAAPAEGEEPAAPQLAFEPGSYDFGLHEANRENAQNNFQLRNVGSVPAPIYSLQIVGSGSSAFWIGNSDCYGRTLEPGETCSVQVNFNPYDVAPFSAQLRAESAASTSFTAELSGEGGRPELTAATNPTNFGSVAVGAAGVIKTIDVTNEGNMPGGAFIAVISGGAVGSFHLLDENCTGTPLSPEATCNLQVSFDPISTGAKTARLFLVGDGDGGVQITLTGVGLESAAQSGGAPPLQTSTAASQSQPKPRRKRRNRAQRRYVAPSVAVIAPRRATR